MRHLSILVTVLWALGLSCAQAASGPVQQACPAVSSNIPSANAAALAFFKQRVMNAGDVGAAPRSRPQGFDSAEAHGARGDGVADDTRALQDALNSGKGVWLEPGHVYRFTRRLQLGNGASLVSDGSATLLMAAGPQGFDNQVARRSDNALYGERGAGLRLTGRNITISDLFLVKEYADDRYVIGIDVVGSSDVAIRRVRLRGFSLAPGIVTIRSSDRVEFASSLIHASCTQSREVPPDVATFQITGISVDDSTVGGRGSTALRIHNNVISDLRMMPVTPRGEQSDGINFAGSGIGGGSLISGNDIQGVDEALDLFGAGIEVSGNRLAATGRVLKLIHGARRIVVKDNEITPGPDGQAIGLYRANPDEARRQVQDVVIERNRLHLEATRRTGILVDAKGENSPTGVVIRQNKFLVIQCHQEAVSCSSRQCKEERNDKVQPGGAAACKE